MRPIMAALCFAVASPVSAQHLAATSVYDFPASKGPERELTFSPDSRMLATSSADGDVRLWTIADRKLAATLHHPAGLTSVSFSPDGKLLATGSYDGRVRIWNIATSSLLRTIPASNATVWTVDFSPDGRTVASGGEDSVVKIWRVADGAGVHTLRGHTRNVWSVAFSPDGKHIASGSFDKTAKLWNPETGKLERTLTGSGEAIVNLGFSPDGSLLATGGDDEAIRLWRVSDGQVVRKISTGNHVYSVSFSQNGKWLVSGGRGRGPVGTFLHQIAGGRFSGSKPTTARLWRVRDGAMVRELKGHADDVWDVAFSPDGRWLATSSEDGTLKLWSLTEFP